MASITKAFRRTPQQKTRRGQKPFHYSNTPSKSKQYGPRPKHHSRQNPARRSHCPCITTKHKIKRKTRKHRKATRPRLNAIIRLWPNHSRHHNTKPGHQATGYRNNTAKVNSKRNRQTKTHHPLVRQNLLPSLQKQPKRQNHLQKRFRPKSLQNATAQKTQHAKQQHKI
ncbi:MAG: hypothetical protein HS113_29775 [Verrucomicrobiales bacterium]|nr:hypothetical protein [Verrucomicrobiales bacterium]